MEDIKKDPFNFICDWAEKILPYTGRKAFEIISLMPCSLILPDLIYKGKNIRTNINVLLLTSPGGGKSSISQMLSYIGYNSIELRSITPAKLESKIQATPLFTLIVEEYSTMSKDPIIAKIIEGVLGEEKKMQRATMRKDVEIDTEAVGLLCGVPTDLHEHLTGGLIFRLIPICIFHSEDEHSKIGKEITNGIGIEGEFDEKEEIIKKYYLELMKIQAGDNPDINRIIGYCIEDKFKEDAYKIWDGYTRQIYKRIKAPFNWFRSLHEFCRILVSHAFLNIYDRKCENGILYPTKEDYKVAIRLMKKDLNIKYKLISTGIFVKNIASLKELSRVMKSEKVDDEQKNLIKSLIQIKRGKPIAK